MYSKQVAKLSEMSSICKSSQQTIEALEVQLARIKGASLTLPALVEMAEDFPKIANMEIKGLEDVIVNGIEEAIEAYRKSLKSEMKNVSTYLNRVFRGE